MEDDDDDDLVDDVVDPLYKIKAYAQQISKVSGGVIKIAYEKILGDTNAANSVIELVQAFSSVTKPELSTINKDPTQRPPLTLPTNDNLDIRLFSWQLSYFSGKIRAFLRYKSRVDGLKFDDINASPSIIQHLLVPHTDTNVVPQIQLPNGSFVQDSTEIIDVVDRMFPGNNTTVLPSLRERPKQRMVCRLLELFGDEWLLVAAYHWRWAYSCDEQQGQFMFSGHRRSTVGTTGSATETYLDPNHRLFNAMQWGRFMKSNATGLEQERAGNLLFDAMMYRNGPKLGCICLGISDDKMADAFEHSTLRFLSLFETHLCQPGNWFVLGSRPSLADFGLLGPLYAHLYQDPVPGYLMRTRYPNVAEWCDRMHNRGGAIRRQRSMEYNRDDGTLTDNDAQTSSEWYPDDAVPDTVVAMLRVFYDEMWPVLRSAAAKLTSYLDDGSGRPRRGVGVPGKSFGPSLPEQFGRGPLTHSFEIPVYDRMGTQGRRTKYREYVDGEERATTMKKLSGRRMVVPYQMWMLGRIADDVVEMRTECSTAKQESVRILLSKCGDKGEGEESMMSVDRMLLKCRLRKIGGKLFSIGDGAGDGVRKESKL